MTATDVSTIIERNGLTVFLLLGALLWIQRFVNRSLQNAREDQVRLWDEMKGDREALVQIVRDSTTATIGASEAIRTNTKALDHLSAAVERMSRA